MVFGGVGGEGVDIDNDTVVVDEFVVRPSACLFAGHFASAARLSRHAESLW
jgi:hypothetical protein